MDHLLKVLVQLENDHLNNIFIYNNSELKDVLYKHGSIALNRFFGLFSGRNANVLGWRESVGNF